MLGEKTAANALLLQELTDRTGVECARIHARMHVHMRTISTLMGRETKHKELSISDLMSTAGSTLPCLIKLHGSDYVHSFSLKHQHQTKFMGSFLTLCQNCLFLNLY